MKTKTENGNDKGAMDMQRGDRLAVESAGRERNVRRKNGGKGGRGNNRGGREQGHSASAGKQKRGKAVQPVSVPKVRKPDQKRDGKLESGKNELVQQVRTGNQLVGGAKKDTLAGKLCELNVCASLAEARRLILAGFVQVDGWTVIDANANVRPKSKIEVRRKTTKADAAPFSEDTAGELLEAVRSECPDVLQGKHLDTGALARQLGALAVDGTLSISKSQRGLLVLASFQLAKWMGWTPERGFGT